MNIEEQRKAFEAECNLLKYNGDMTFDHIGNFYIDHTTNWMWQMWLSSVNRKGFKLVPVEATDFMKCSVRDFDPDIEEYANMNKMEWEELCGDIYKAMIGACDD